MTRSRSRGIFLGISSVAAVWFVTLAIATSGIGRSLSCFVFGVYSGVALLVAWLVAVALFRKAHPSRWLAVVVPLCLTLGALLLQVSPSRNPFFRLRFLASRPALARIVEAALVSESTASRQRVVALFVVDRVLVTEGHVEFLVSCGMLDECGIAYVPLGRPAQIQGVSRSLGGPWYHFHRHL